MQFRTFPRIPDLPISTLGFGAMRLPIVGGDPSRIDEAEAARLVHQAIEGGVNYVDTAYVYHGGESERFLSRALKGGWREKVQLATKLPVWEAHQPGDFERLLDAQLRKLDTDHLDFYLLHAIDGERWDEIVKLDGMRAMERARADGRVRHVGFSFHGALDDFKRIIDAYDWEFTQIQLNYLDEGYQAGIEGLRHAAARRVGVIVMEPLRGGALAKAPPAVEALWARSGQPWSPAEWALRWVLGQPGVVTVLSGMGALAQVQENLRIAAAASPLGAAELALVEEAKRYYHARMAIPCTTCGYCQPCPSGVAIPEVFSAWNSAMMFGSKAGPAWAYRTFQLANDAGADQCSECGDCEPKCPQHLHITEDLQKAHAFLTAP
jgi:predicted aldo/keto reductase-like oxidoreductase